MTSETPDVELSSGELGDLAAAYGWWNAHGDPEAFYDVLDAAVQRILAAVETAHARDLAALRERAEVAEAKVAAVEGLVVQWERDRRGYPSTLQGRYAETAVKLCERELTAALADRPVGGEGR